MEKRSKLVNIFDNATDVVEIFDDSDLCVITDASPKVGDDGILRVNARFARTGVQSYTLADGSVERRYRPAEEVFAADSLASWAQRVVTSDHPPVMVDSANSKQFMVGMSGETAWREGKFVMTKLAIADKQAIADVMSGRRRQLSAGYKAMLERTPGVSPEGEHYDVIMRQIGGNHIALVAAARGGSALQPQLDAPDNVAVADANKPSDSPPAGETKMAKMKLNGVEREVPDNLVDAIQGELATVRTELTATVSTLDGELAAEKARNEQLGKELKTVKDSALTVEDAMDKARGRIALEAEVKEVLGKDVKIEAKDSDDQLRRKVLGKLAATTVLDGKDEAFVAGMYSALIANRTTVKDHAGDARRSAIADDRGHGGSSASGMTTDAKGNQVPVMTVDAVDRAARTAMMTSHKRPITGAATK